jgi:hypothetical protein
MRTAKSSKNKLPLAKLQKAKSKGTLVFVRHFADSAVCDICGKKNPTWAVAICLSAEDAKADYAQVGPLYLNGDCWLVGAQCLKELKAKIDSRKPR